MFVGVSVPVTVNVFVTVDVTVLVGVFVGVSVLVTVFVGVTVGVAVAHSSHSLHLLASETIPTIAFGISLVVVTFCISWKHPICVFTKLPTTASPGLIFINSIISPQQGRPL